MKLFASFIFSVVILSVGIGVFATWQYAERLTDPESEKQGFEIGAFDYTPEEIIPGGGAVEAPIGQNHLDLIEVILHEEDYGLNATKKPIIHNYLQANGDVVYCDMTTTKGNLKKLMIDSSSNSQRLYFVVTRISPTEYHTFTMRYSDLSNPVGTEIETYKTVMIKGNDGEWTAPYSYFGYTKVFDPGIVNVAIDVTSWRDA